MSKSIDQKVEAMIQKRKAGMPYKLLEQDDSAPCHSPVFEVGDLVLNHAGKEYKVIKVYLKSRKGHKVKVVDVTDSKNRILKSLDTFYFNKSK